MGQTEPLLADALGATGGDEGVVERALATVRRHLGMDVAYLSEFVDGRAVFRAVDAPGFEALAHVGVSIPLQDVYCQHIIEGRLPELIPDTADEPLAMSLAITAAVPIGAHVSIPIRRPDGSPYGMFCCLSTRPNRSLNTRDLEIMRAFADLASREIDQEVSERATRQSIDDRISAVLDHNGFRIAYQPIFELDDPTPTGFEALCRFTPEPYRTPDVWFAEAAHVGRQVELELAAIRAALDALPHLPEHVYVSVNASPETVLRGGLYDVFAVGFERVVLEVTEHAVVADYAALAAALAPLRFQGVRLAVDDAGAGYSGLQHILRLRPDILKLDSALTRNVDTDFARRSLATALAHFATQTRAIIVAEGIETEGELAALRALGIQRGQGYHLGRPEALAAAQDWFRVGNGSAASVA